MSVMMRAFMLSTCHVEACFLLKQPLEAPALAVMLTATCNLVRYLNACSWWLQKNKPLSADVAAGMSPAKSEAAILELAQVRLHAGAAKKRACMIFSWTHDAGQLHQSTNWVELSIA